MSSTSKTENEPRPEGVNIPASLSNTGKMELVERIAASHHLNKSVRLSELLRYLVERSINSPAEGLREQEIGANLFGREADYDTSQDNIVRVQVSQLRKKLVAYFNEEGRAEPFLIEIPRGAYLPVFVERMNQQARLAPATRVARLPWLPLLLLLTTIFFATLSIWLWRRQAGPVSAGVPIDAPLPSRGRAVSSLWGAMFNQERPSDLVLADSTLTILQDQAGRTLHLDEVLQRRFAEALPATLPENERKQILAIVARRYTSFTDVELLGKILRIVHTDVWPDVRPPALTIAREYRMRSFKSNNVILLGSKRSNPWVELVEPQMNFTFHYPDGQRNPVIINRTPRAGEEPVYNPLDGRGYAVIAFLPNPNNAGHILILAGDNAVSTEAAGEFVSSEEHLSRFFEQIGYEPAPQGEPAPPPFEILLETEKLQGSPRSFQIVSYRVSRK